MRKIVIILLAFALMFSLVACGNDKADSTEPTTDKEEGATTEEQEPEESEAGEATEFSMFPGGEDLAEINVGEWYKSSGRFEPYAILFPENYTIKSGKMFHLDENEEKQSTVVEGVLSDLIQEKQINLPDKVLAKFYIGTGDYDTMEPAEKDTIYEVAVYNGWDYEEKAEYSASHNGVDYYGMSGDRFSSTPSHYKEVNLPIDENFYLSIRCIAGPGIENITVEEFVDAIAEYVRPLEPAENEGAVSEENATDVETPVAETETEEGAADDGFGIPLLYNGNDASDDFIDVLKNDGWIPVFVISHSVDFENTKYQNAGFTIRFTDQIDTDMFDDEISNIEAIDGSDIKSIQFNPNLSFEDAEHPTFEVLGISSNMTPEEVIEVLDTLELDDPDSQVNWDNLDEKGSGESQRFDVIVGENTYDIDIEYNYGKIWRMRIWKNE